MKRIQAKAIIGAGYGDEGKGRMVEYFANQFNEAEQIKATQHYCKTGNTDYDSEHILNIRSNGGAQAAHAVCKLAVHNRESGKTMYIENVFRQMGSGTLSGAVTYLSKFFTVNLDMLKNELEYLNDIYNQGYIKMQPLVYVDRDAYITLPIDIVINRKLEELRGSNKHGSCGLGIWESQLRQKAGLGVKIGEMYKLNKNGSNGAKDIVNELLKIQKKYLDIRINELHENEEFKQLKKESFDFEIGIYIATYKLVETMFLLLKYNSFEILSFDTKKLVNDIGLIIFENAQGLELSLNTRENFPNISTSDTGVSNILQLIKDFKTVHDVDIIPEFVFLTRSYKTRHGAGELPYEEFGEQIREDFHLFDRTNATNKYQGNFRYAPLDLNRLNELIDRETKKLSDDLGIYKKSIAIGHLDETHGLALVHENSEVKVLDANEITANNMLKANHKYYLSYGRLSNNTVEVDVKR